MSDITHRAAVHVIDWFHRAEKDILGATIQTFQGEAGTVKEIRLDEAHGLCFTLDEKPKAFDPDIRRFYPVSTIRMRK